MLFVTLIILRSTIRIIVATTIAAIAMIGIGVSAVSN